MRETTEKIKFTVPGTDITLMWRDRRLASDCGKYVFDTVEGIPVILPDKSENYIDHYKRDAEQFDYFSTQDAATEADFERIRQVVLEHIPKKADIVLDIGSGNGWLALRLKDRKQFCVSADISLKNLLKIKKFVGTDYGMQVVADALNPPFGKESFDCIVASEVIEHITEPERFIRSLADLLVPGGSLIITTPYMEKLKFDLCVHCNKPTPRNAHLHSFDEKALACFAKGELFKYCKFGNKAMIFSRLYSLLRFLPFKIWEPLDKICNFLLNKPAHILAVYIKPPL